MLRQSVVAFALLMLFGISPAAAQSAPTKMSNPNEGSSGGSTGAPGSCVSVLPGFHWSQWTGTVFLPIDNQGRAPNGLLILQNNSSLDFFKLAPAVLDPLPFSGQTLRMEWYGNLKPDVNSSCVGDVVHDGPDASLDLVRGGFFWAGLRLFYHERYTNSDDLFRLFWMNPDESIEVVTTRGVEFARELGRLSLNLVYADYGNHELRGLRLTHHLGGTETTVGLTGAWGWGEVVGLDLRRRMGTAEFATEVAFAGGSADRWGLGLALKNEGFDPFTYNLEYTSTESGFSTPDSDWYRENCEKLRGVFNYVPATGIYLNAVYESYRTRDGQVKNTERSASVTLSCLGPINLSLTRCLLDSLGLEQTKISEVYLCYMPEGATISLFLRDNSSRGFEPEIFVSWWTPSMDWQVTARATLLADFPGYGFDLTRRLARGSEFSLSYTANRDLALGQNSHLLTAGFVF